MFATTSRAPVIQTVDREVHVRNCELTATRAPASRQTASRQTRAAARSRGRGSRICRRASVRNKWEGTDSGLQAQGGSDASFEVGKGRKPRKPGKKQAPKQQRNAGRDPRGSRDAARHEQGEQATGRTATSLTNNPARRRHEQQQSAVRDVRKGNRSLQICEPTDALEQAGVAGGQAQQLSSHKRGGTQRSTEHNEPAGFRGQRVAAHPDKTISGSRSPIPGRTWPAAFQIRVLPWFT